MCIRDRFFPAGYTLDNYANIMFHPDSVAQFPRWFVNTFVVACFTCVISTCFVLMVAYALSCCRFKGDVYKRQYLDCVADTYYGEALAIVRAGEGNSLTLTADDGMYSTAVTVPVTH